MSIIVPYKLLIAFTVMAKMVICCFDVQLTRLSMHRSCSDKFLTRFDIRPRGPPTKINGAFVDYSTFVI